MLKTQICVTCPQCVKIHYNITLPVADELARGASVLGFLRPEPALGVSRQDIKKGSVVGWQASTGQDGESLAIHKDGLEN